MKRKWYTEERIISTLKEREAGASAPDSAFLLRVWLARYEDYVAENAEENGRRANCPVDLELPLRSRISGAPLSPNTSYPDTRR